jgi:1-acyl-sn-glycerol-3-phosphate acyltransferase
MMGWTIKGSLPEGLKKAVVISAPHTSMWDFIIGRIAFYSFGIYNINFLIKKEMFKFPVGGLLRSLGAIPIDRGKNNTTIQIVSKMFEEKENFLLLITPEGTRGYARQWKKGFYHFAEKAKVPIVMTYIDYGKKEGGIGPVLYPTGDFDADFKIITDFYRGMTAKYPENFNLSAQYLK